MAAWLGEWIPFRYAHVKLDRTLSSTQMHSPGNAVDVSGGIDEDDDDADGDDDDDGEVSGAESI